MTAGSTRFKRRCATLADLRGSPSMHSGKTQLWIDDLRLPAVVMCLSLDAMSRCDVTMRCRDDDYRCDDDGGKPIENWSSERAGLSRCFIDKTKHQTSITTQNVSAFQTSNEHYYTNVSAFQTRPNKCSSLRHRSNINLGPQNVR